MPWTVRLLSLLLLLCALASSCIGHIQVMIPRGTENGHEQTAVGGSTSQGRTDNGKTSQHSRGE